MKRVDIVQYIDELIDDKELKIMDVHYLEKESAEDDDLPDLESVKFLFGSPEEVAYFNKFAENVARKQELSNEQIIKEHDDFSVKIDPKFLEMLADHTKTIPFKFKNMMAILEEELENMVGLEEYSTFSQRFKAIAKREFNNRIERIKKGFKNERNDLKLELLALKVPEKNVTAFLEDMNRAQEDLFDKLKFNSRKAEVIGALNMYLTNSFYAFHKHEKIMDYGLLYKFIETPLKAVAILFVSIGMVFGSAFKRGLASLEDREWFKKNFLTFNKTSASQTMFNLKNKHKSYEEITTPKPKSKSKPKPKPEGSPKNQSAAESKEDPEKASDMSKASEPQSGPGGGL